MFGGELIVGTILVGFIGITIYLFYFKPKVKVNDRDKKKTKATTSGQNKKQNKSQGPNKGQGKKKKNAPNASGKGTAPSGGKSKGKGGKSKKKKSAISKLTSRLQDDRSRAKVKPPINFADHNNLFSVIRGHIGNITGISFSPKSRPGHVYVFVTSEDGYLSVWSDFEEGKSLFREFGRLSISANGDGHPTAICISADGHAVTVASAGNPRKRREGSIMIFEFRNKRQMRELEDEKETVTEKEQLCPLTLKHKFRATNDERIDFIHAEHLESQSSYMVTGSTANSTRLVMYRAKTGDELNRTPVRHIQNRSIAISADGNSICVATYQNCAVLFEVQRNKTSGTFEGLEKLKSFGHSAKINVHHSPLVGAFFINDDTCVVTVDERGIVCVWNIDVNYAREEVPVVLQEMDLSEEHEEDFPIVVADFYNGESVGLLALVTMAKVIFFDIRAETVVGTLEDIAQSGGVTRVTFSPDGMLLATAGPDTDVRLYHTPLAV